ncbi:MAG TPA: VWA domain-containing protein [Anaerolineales bacterium]|nr:VWA domain-containing protein [Anaerolineales bacterium]
MEDRIIRFVSALRAAGVRISLAESADAFLAVDDIGIQNREVFRLSLRTTLVKDAANLPVFEELFPLFFGAAESPPMADPSEDLTPEEADMLADALRQFSDRLREMLDKLARGDQLSQEQLEQLAKFVGLNQADDLRYREWMVQRMKKALSFKQVQDALRELAEILSEMGMDRQRVDQLMKLMQANQQSMEDQLRQFAGQQIADNMSERPPQEGVDKLMNQPFSSLSDGDMQVLRKEVRRLAAILRTRVALRQKRAKSGQLDAKATIRANLKHASVPLEIKHRARTLKPKLIVFCDISTSMRSCSEMMLSLLYAMQDQISKTHAFAFIDHMEFISPDFQVQSPVDAVSQVLKSMPSGYYNTDFGSSLENFYDEYLELADNRTTFIVVGDGRNNYNNPRLDLFNLLARRCRRTIWITPETPALWGTGDSDMLKYVAGCDVVLQAATLAQLTAAVDKLLQP